MENEYTVENRKKRGLQQLREFSMPAYEDYELDNSAVDNWVLNDNWLLNMLSEVRILPLAKIER